MDKRLAIGIAAFSLTITTLDLAFQALSSLVGWRSQFTTLVTYFFATPVALWLAIKAGRVTRGTVLLASFAVAVVTLGAITFLFDFVARPAGGNVSWRALFDEAFRHHTVTWIAMAVLAPQFWLWVISGKVADNSINPMRRGRTG